MKSPQARLPFVAYAAILLAAMNVSAPAFAVEEPPLASQEEITKAFASFKGWLAATQADDFDQLWLLNDPRIRQWHDKRSWKKRMKTARNQTGAIVSSDIEVVSPVTASQLPCTEMGHCYRKDVQYVFILLRSTYAKAAPAQPEYVVMAKSEEGWKFGGGTFPDTPMGETSSILNRKDEHRYRYRDTNSGN